MHRSPTATAPMIEGPYSLASPLTCSSCSSSVKYSLMSAPPPRPPLQTQQRPQAFTDRLERAFFLRALLAQGFERHHAARELILAEHEREARAALVGALELGLEAPSAEVHLQRQAGPRRAQPLGEREPFDLAALTREHQVHLGFGAGHHEPLALEQHDDALLPHRPADRWSIRIRYACSSRVRAPGVARHDTRCRHA